LSRKRQALLICALALCALLFASCSIKAESPAYAPDSAADRPAAAQTKQSVESLPLQIMNYAKEGSLPIAKFVVGQTTIREVERQLGKAARIRQERSGYYAVYPEQGIAVGYNEAGVVFALRSFDSSLRALTAPAIEDALGKPAKQTAHGEKAIYTYRVDGNVLLKFVIPAATGRVDHISVFRPPAEADPYLLAIEGESDRLSASAWESMTAWRKKIVAFAGVYPNRVWINGPNRKQVALTFDDGPDERNTLAVADILDRYQVKGSFFFVGDRVRQYPETVKQIYDGGHLVLSHSNSHKQLIQLAESDVAADLQEAGKAIEAVIGRIPALLRTPYGETNNMVVRAAERLGYSIVLWSLDTLDWSSKDERQIVGNVQNYARNGEIILMHSSQGNGSTVAALPAVIETLRQKGFEMVDLATLLGVPAYQEPSS